MNRILVVPTSGVENGRPQEWFAQRLDAAIAHAREHAGDAITFIVTGQWNNIEAEFVQTEAEVAKKYILEKLPDAKIIKEEISVETGGNMAFSKPLITACRPDAVIVFCSRVHVPRIRYLAEKVFDPAWRTEFVAIRDSLSDNPRAKAKEPKALRMFQKLLDGIDAGDDAAARETLLYKTPFYFRGLLDEKEFFNSHWPGGFEDFKEKRLSIDNK